jgi:prolyl-tRNA synthetase
MTIRPYGYAIWELIQKQFDDIIKSMGVQNCYFPTMIPLSFFQKEAEHVDGFAKESAVITHYRLKSEDGKIVVDDEAKLTEPYILRPTSETLIGDAMSRWVNSYRDLPMLLNQWANVFRWEMRPRMFLRTSEFLWQEGHCAFATKEESLKQALEILHLYQEYGASKLGLFSYIGEKTPEERFAGADNTFTFETMSQDGKACQSGTSHDLGQHFAKSFNIKYQSVEGKDEFAWTNSWGWSTRLIGAMIVAHADDDGLVLPPAVAPYQVVIIPFMKADMNVEKLDEYCQDVKDKLMSLGIRVHFDNTDARSSDKVWKWIKKGVPVRIEVGSKEIEDGTLTVTRRDLGKASQQTIALGEIDKIAGLLDDVQKAVFEKHKKLTLDSTKEVKTVGDAQKLLAEDFKGFIKLPYRETLSEKYEELKEKYKVTRRCLPLGEEDLVIIAKSF